MIYFRTASACRHKPTLPVRNLAIAGTADAASDFDTTNLPALVNVSGIHYFGNFSGVGVQAFAAIAKIAAMHIRRPRLIPRQDRLPALKSLMAERPTRAMGWA